MNRNGYKSKINSESSSTSTIQDKSYSVDYKQITSDHHRNIWNWKFIIEDKISNEIFPKFEIILRIENLLNLMGHISFQITLESQN